MRASTLGLALGLLLTGPLHAADLAILVAGRNYDRLPDLRNTREVFDLAEPLEEAGFRVIRLEDRSAAQLQSTIASYRADMEAAERLVFVAAGYVVSDGRNNWFLGDDARAPDVFAIGGAGLPLRPILDIAAGKPGASIVALSSAERGIRLGDGLEQGFLSVDVPQGVSVISGPVRELTVFLRDSALTPGVALGAALQDAPDGVAGFGFLPLQTAFLPAPAERQTQSLDPEDQAFWERMQRIDTADAYGRYLERFPSGAFAAAAESRLDALNQSPEARAEAAEAGLGLNRDARREIQRNLTILGFDTRGVDGIFGGGTRAAIAAWQASANQDRTGYLTGNQISRLQIAAAVRARELEEEAARRQEQQDRQDGEYWRDTGRGETESGLRQYLDRYPEGLFSDVARERLGAIEAERRASAERAEREFWEDVRGADTASAYAQYLDRYPQGAFADEARARQQEIERSAQESDIVAAARAEESRVLANPITRLLVERRLQQLGLRTGPADGRFDDDTRRAIRRYQRSRDLDVTGYVTRDTLVRILAGGG
ncbi:MAG: hypothetical protein HKN63_06035 [Rhodobacteraceae bacterium]|nr:hypothetical protein [Paracoccaceae bacterium]